MRGLRWLALGLASTFCLLTQPVVSKPVSAERADVRVLIDISGSMKRNDPQNLRRPALRLLVGLLPEQTRAGVWTFAQYVNMLIPLGEVDKAWKYQARQNSQKIGSPGQYTNIEDALKRSTEDWSGSPDQTRRSLLLLTDGMVDVSRRESENRASRERILHTILPRLQQLGVAIHTVALSKNADHELMQELAHSTGGWYEQVENAGQLQKVFLRIFEKVGKPDAVPLQDNQFTIDNSITEATVLVFHEPGAQATRVIPPGGQPFSANNAPSFVSWHMDEGYDMLTIHEPKVGEWRIQAELDPDNRVMVVTDLKMKTSGLPNRLVQGQRVVLQAVFLDHGKPIRRRSFLEMVSVKTVNTQMAKPQARLLLDDGKRADKKAGDGIFSLELEGDSLPAGIGEFVMKADGQTFVREKRIGYEVVPPVNLQIEPGDSHGKLSLTLTPEAQWVKSGSIEVQVWLEDQAGVQQTLELSSTADGKRHGEIDILNFSGARKVFVKADGETLKGSPVNYLDSPMEIEGIQPVRVDTRVESESAQTVESLPEPLVSDPPATEPSQPAESKEQTVDDPKELQPDEEAGWLSASIWLLVVNFLLVLAAGGAYWWMRKRESKSLVSLIDESPAPVAEQKEKAA